MLTVSSIVISLIVVPIIVVVSVMFVMIVLMYYSRMYYEKRLVVNVEIPTGILGHLIYYRDVNLVSSIA
jgi:hypothetical protein